MKNFHDLPEDASTDDVRKSLTKFRPGMVREVCQLLEIKHPRVLKKAANIQAILLHESIEAVILAHNIVAYNRMTARENWKTIGSKTKEWLVANFQNYLQWIKRFIKLVSNWNLESIFAQLDQPEPTEATEQPAV